VAARRASPALGLAAQARGFRARSGADIRLALSHAPIPRATGRLLFDSGAVWRVERHAGGWLYTFRTPALTQPVYKAVAIDAGLRRGTLFFPPRRRGPRHALEFPLDELLFQHRLAREGGLEVHACGLVLEGRAVLLCGRSGAGKSTTARLWRRHRRAVPILSDDRIALRPRRDALYAFGTPWHGDGGFATPAGAPLGAVFILSHGRRNRIRRLAPAAAAARLFARSFPPPWDRAAVASVLATCVKVARVVPCFSFAFRPQAAAVAAVEAAVRAAVQPRARPSETRRPSASATTRSTR